MHALVHKHFIANLVTFVVIILMLSNHILILFLIPALNCDLILFSKTVKFFNSLNAKKNCRLRENFWRLTTTRIFWAILHSNLHLLLCWLTES